MNGSGEEELQQKMNRYEYQTFIFPDPHLQTDQTPDKC